MVKTFLAWTESDWNLLFVMKLRVKILLIKITHKSGQNFLTFIGKWILFTKESKNRSPKY